MPLKTEQNKNILIKTKFVLNNNKNHKESPFSPNSDRFFPQCWIRVRLMAGSDIIDRILGNYHTLSNHLAEGK